MVAAPSAEWLCPCLPLPTPPGRGAGRVGFLWCTGGWDLGRQNLVEAGGEDLGRGLKPRGPGSQEVGASTRMLRAGDTPPNPRKAEKRTVPEHCEGPRRARSHSHGPPLAPRTRRARRRQGFSGRPQRRRQQRNSNKSSERLPGPGGCSYGSQSSAGPGSVRSTRGGGGGHVACFPHS